ncbi:hypothetical protein TrLO_g10599 [Triparma laevis f. longispina]|uniref:Uncharacterized protein n=1 Tax=Triparma laevis f. longispina TaxID=1714387 RepID=A0A9W7AT82_9STRA|nr:hypothetical protein TrLO_g10599 [Triparma laevis f. longispina]
MSKAVPVVKAEVEQLRRRVKTVISRSSPNRQSISIPRDPKSRSSNKAKKVDPKTDWREYKKAKAISAFNLFLNRVGNTGGRKSMQSNADEVIEPHGNLTVHVKKAHICGRKCNKRLKTHYYGFSGKEYDNGECKFLATVTFEDCFEQTPPATSYEPSFENICKPFNFPVYQYQSKLYIDLFDEQFTSNLIGDTSISLFSIIEKQTQKAMKRVGGLRAKFLEVKANEFSNEGERKVTILETLKSLNTNEEYEWVDLTDSRDSVVGKVCINVKFDERVMTCFSKKSPESRQRIEVEEKEFALEALKEASVRISKLARIKTELEIMHQSILNFERFWESVAWLVGSIAICLRFDSEYLPFYLGSMFIVMMLYNLRERVRGTTILHLLHESEGSGVNRRIGKLRIAVQSAEIKDKKGVSGVDPLVRCYYSTPTGNEEREGEKGANSAHRHYIGRTKTLEKTFTPNFQSPEEKNEDRGKKENEQSFTKTVAAGKKWWIARSKLRKAGVRDAVLHNVTSAWKHNDGEIDWHCLKYPILQEVEGTGTKKKALGWNMIQSLLHFDLHHAGKAGERMLGRASVPVKALVSNHSGGIQDLRNVEIDVANLHGEKVATVRVRLQLKLPQAGSSFSELDRMNMESLEEMLDNERELGIVGRVKKVRDIAMSIQDGLENIANFFERVRHILLWTHPAKTAVILAYISCGVVASYFIPFRYLLIMKILKDFWKGFCHRPKTRSFYNRINNVLNTIPTAKEMSAVYANERTALQEMTRAVQHSEAMKVTLQAIWSGQLYKRGTFNKAMKERFIVVRSGYICWWKQSSHAERGMPPRGRLYIPPGGHFGVNKLFLDVNKKDDGRIGFNMLGLENPADSQCVKRAFEIETGFEGFKLAVLAASGATEGSDAYAEKVRQLSI